MIDKQINKQGLKKREKRSERKVKKERKNDNYVLHNNNVTNDIGERTDNEKNPNDYRNLTE